MLWSNAKFGNGRRHCHGAGPLPREHTAANPPPVWSNNWFESLPPRDNACRSRPTRIVEQSRVSLSTGYPRIVLDCWGDPRIGVPCEYPGARVGLRSWERRPGDGVLVVRLEVLRLARKILYTINNVGREDAQGRAGA
jgi:hypothetical protein